MIKKFLILVIIGLCLPAIKARAEEKVVYQITNRQGREIGRNNTYDYSASVINENGVENIYVCGGAPSGEAYSGHDAIYLTTITNGSYSRNSLRVLSPLVDSNGDDSLHACSPSVIKHSFGQLFNGKEQYLMYYECAPNVYRTSDNQKIGAFTQICLAFSDDGINWKKYNQSLWNNNGRMAEMTEPATAIIPFTESMKSSFGISITNGKYYMAKVPDANSYGSGHPSAVVINGEIWIYYYATTGDWNTRGLFLAKTDDGFHIKSTERIAAIKSPVRVVYMNAAVGNHNGYWLSFSGGFGVMGYNYSWDGISWEWQEEDRESFYTDFLKNNYSVGTPLETSRCTSPGRTTMATDSRGWVNSTVVEMFTGEGKLGASDGCTLNNGCKCYSSAEDTSRGSTWQTYGFEAKFEGLKIGDANKDGKVDLSDYLVWYSEFTTNKTTNLQADFNSDNKTDLSDYLGWYSEFTK